MHLLRFHKTKIKFCQRTHKVCQLNIFYYTSYIIYSIRKDDYVISVLNVLDVFQ